MLDEVNGDTTHRSLSVADACGRQLTYHLKPPPPEAASLNNPYYSRSQQAPVTISCAPLARPRIQWPQSPKRTEWKQFDEDVDQVLEVTAKGDVDHRLKTMTILIVSIAVEPRHPSLHHRHLCRATEQRRSSTSKKSLSC